MQAKTPFLRAECCRLLSVILKRKKMSEDVLGFIVKEGLNLARNIGKILTGAGAEESQGSKEKDIRTKRLRPILLCAKDLSIMMKGMGKTHTKAYEKTMSELMNAIQSVPELNPNLAQLAQNILSNFAEIEQNEVEGNRQMNSEVGSKRKHDLSMSSELEGSRGGKKTDKKNEGMSDKQETATYGMRDWSREDKELASAKAKVKMKKRARMQDVTL